MSETILTVLVGSKAHGLETPTSDTDLRGVFVDRTHHFLEVGGEKPRATSWVEEGDKGGEDNTAYEVGHFLHLATRCNPSILEMFRAFTAPQTTHDGLRLQALFPHVWNPLGVYHAFTGYSHNQQVKFLSNKPEFAQHKWKYAVAYIRVLLQCNQLLSTGSFEMRVEEPWRATLRDIRAGVYTTGQVMDMAEVLKAEAKRWYEGHAPKETDLYRVNEYLLELRKRNW